MKKAGARIVMKGQSLAFDLWYTSAMDAKEKMALVKKAGARIIMRGISMAWLNWHDVYSSAKGERDNGCGDVQQCGMMCESLGPKCITIHWAWRRMRLYRLTCSLPVRSPLAANTRWVSGTVTSL